MHPRSVVVFGAGGRLGGAVLRAVQRDGGEVQPLNWLEPDGKVPISRDALVTQLGRLAGEVDIVFASGLTDPRASETELMLANVERPLGLIEATMDERRFRYLSIGSVLETSALAPNNRYLASKAAYGNHVEGLAAEARLRHRIAHLRGHTFYGGAPAPHSFLGQMHDSLRERRGFRMSEGRQLREYAHIDDVAWSIAALLSRDWSGPAVLDLSTGEPVTLSALAQAVFKHFGCEDLLQIGALPTPPGENQGFIFPRSPDWLLGQPRPAIEGITEWLSNLLRRS